MKALVLAPHTDDGELGCGGTISKLINSGNDVYYATFSVCEESVPAGLPKDILEKEVKAATAVLGIVSDNLRLFRYPVRRFNEFRQNILDDLISLRDSINPDLVLMPGKNDIHQDHAVIAAEAIRAFKHSSILAYEMAWNNLTMSTTAFSKLTQHDIDNKANALEKYSSQQGVRNYMSREFTESMAKVRGVQVGCEYAEAFEVIRWIM